ncbi:MAG: DUF2125 domain-containing protein [Methylobacteriaceae bacterium]|nr:DUF2125 domain-containing protein [Methylobacteriaceae bacterium]
MAVTEAQPKRYSRVGLYVPIFALIALAIGWSIFWYVSATITGREIGAWIKREADDGRIWTCPERSVGGYPFRIEISCKTPSFSGPAAGIPVTGALAGIHLVAQLYNPKLIIGEAEGPFDFALPQDGSRTLVNWKLLQISVRGEPDTLQRGSLAADQLDVKVTLPNGSNFNGRADSFQIHVRQGNQDQHAYDFAWSAGNAVSSDLDNATGISAPATLQASGTVAQANAIAGATIPQMLDRWREAGGTLALANATLVQGRLNAQATGTLRLDAAHRVDGRLDLTASGLAPVLQRYGIAPQLLDIGGLIGGLLSGRPPTQGSGQIRVPLTFERGQLGLGPVRGIALLPPLY